MALSPEQKEFKLHVCVVEQLPEWYPYVMFLHIPNRPGSATDGHFKKIMGARAGASDLMVSWNSAKILKAGYIELKVDAALSTPQNKFLSAWSRIGWHTAVCRTAQQVFDKLESWGNVPRSRSVREPRYETFEDKKAAVHNFFMPPIQD